MKEQDQAIEHISRSAMAEFYAGTLSAAEMISYAEHLEDCEICRRRYDEVLRAEQKSSRLVLNLTPEIQFKDDHLEYERIVAYTDSKLEAENRDVVNLHLKVCRPCRDDLSSFLEYRHQVAPEQLEHPQLNRLSRYIRGLIPHFKPLHLITACALALLILASLVAWPLVFSRATKTEQSIEIARTPSVSPDDSLPEVLSAASTGSEQTDARREEIQPEARRAVAVEANSIPERESHLIVLNDRGRRYGLDRTGNLVGLTDLPPALQRTVQRALNTGVVTARLPDELKSPVVKPRGISAENKVTLLSPTKTVITTERPLMQWKPVTGATSYVVTIVDPAFNLIAKSPVIKETKWQVEQPLKPDTTYLWQVTAFRNEEEIESEQHVVARFRVAAPNVIAQLKRYRESYSSHLVMGLLHAKEGMLEEAEREFQLLLMANPNSRSLKKLLRSIQADRR